jgi:DNA-binding NarL/FixJ family response regulator
MEAGMLSGAAATPQIDVLLVTQDLAVGEALRFACASRGIDFIVAEVVPSGADKASVIILDLRSNGLGLEGLVGLRRSRAQRVIAIGERPAGAVGARLDVCLNADARVEELVAAITQTDRSRARTSLVPKTELDALTARERQVMGLLLAGLGAEEIGLRLGIAANTVRTHLQNVLTKLGVSSRAEAASWALRAGLEPAEPATGEAR